MYSPDKLASGEKSRIIKSCLVGAAVILSACTSGSSKGTHDMPENRTPSSQPGQSNEPGAALTPRQYEHALHRKLDSNSEAHLAFRLLRHDGYTRVASAAIVGTMEAESEVDSLVDQPGLRGVLGWPPNQKEWHKLIKYADNTHQVPIKLVTQINYLDHELHTPTFHDTLADLQSQTTAGGAVKVFNTDYQHTPPFRISLTTDYARAVLETN